MIDAIILHRIDPAKNMRRFYWLDVQPDLFWQWCFIREWGRIGRAGQVRTVAYPTAADAHEALALTRAGSPMGAPVQAFNSFSTASAYRGHSSSWSAQRGASVSDTRQDDAVITMLWRTIMPWNRLRESTFQRSGIIRHLKHTVLHIPQYESSSATRYLRGAAAGGRAPSNSAQAAAHAGASVDHAQDPSQDDL